MAKAIDSFDAWLKEDDRHPQFADLVLMPPSTEEAIEQYPEVAGTDLAKSPFEPVQGFPGTRLAMYMVMRGKGESHRMALALALQRCMGTKTDATFFAGMGTLLDSCDGDQNKLTRLVRAARKNGYEPGTGDVYLPNLASKLGDPDAFVSRSDGRAKIRKVCEQRGWACNGAVNVKAREPDQDPYEQKPSLGEDIIGRTAAMMVKKDPSLKKATRRELRERIIQEHAPK